MSASLMASLALAEEAKAPPEVTASAVHAVSADTGKVLYRKGDNKPVRLHSLTKLATADVLVQRFGASLSDTVTIRSSDLTSGASAGLRKGDVWTLEGLLAGMLLVSGNDAALAIANHAGRVLLADESKGGNAMRRFVKEMNALAKSLGAKSARFADPTGLSPANTATAQDVAVIGTAAFREPVLQPFWRCRHRTLAIDGPEARDVALDSTIEILGEDRIVGAKTGSHVGDNIFNLAAAWRAPNGELIVVVLLKSASQEGRYDDMRKILAALPRDFPELAVAAPGVSSVRADTCPEPARKSPAPEQARDGKAN
jgi:D-alanyl-D-alanine carboxypeptidase (penicillin-binding protein 5/6)